MAAGLEAHLGLARSHFPKSPVMVVRSNAVFSGLRPTVFG